MGLRAPAHGDGRVLEQPGQHALTRLRFARRANPAHRHRQAGHAGNAFADSGVGLQRDIDGAGAQALVQPFGRLGSDLYLDAGIGRTQVAQEVDQPGMHHGLDRADAHQPEQLLVGAAQHHDLALQFEHPLAIAEQPQANRRQAQVAGLAFKDAGADLLLERGDAVRHGSLRDVQVVGRGAEAAKPRYPHEGLDETCIQGHLGARRPETTPFMVLSPRICVSVCRGLYLCAQGSRSNGCSCPAVQPGLAPAPNPRTFSRKLAVFAGVDSIRDASARRIETGLPTMSR
ncbi:hypothetical protein D3C81_1427070 [compost metagenome]